MNCRFQILAVASLIGLGFPWLNAVAATSHVRPAATLPYTWKVTSFAKNSRWSVAKGVVTYNGTSNGYLVAPVKIAVGTNFAVQAQIKTVQIGPFPASLMGAGVFAQQKPGDVHTMVDAGTFASGEGYSDDTGPQLEWDMTTAGGDVFNVGSAWHTYRLEVKGPQYTLFIDGKQMVQHTIGEYTNPSRVGIFSAYEQIQARNFQVTPLSNGTTGSSAPEAPFASLVVQIDDLPTDVYWNLGLQHYYSNIEEARFRNEPVQTANDSGLVSDYGVLLHDWSTKYQGVFSSVSQYASSQQADADVSALVEWYRSTMPSTATNVRDLPISEGDTSGGLTYNQPSGFAAPDQLETVSVLFFARSIYLSELKVSSVDALLSPDDNVALAANLAGLVDERITSADHCLPSFAHSWFIENPYLCALRPTAE